ncbi:MAG: hypothetical protein MUF86_02855 [Akkermansiaceae bacterium]|jgi:REP element-mobilizing transposase RayT|nr:hypothetical protein [Akkermansiaceae bacterium]
MNRLTRLDTVFTEAPVYFITACTEKRRHLLADDETHDVFYKFCHQARDLGVLVGRYVLLPDHLHLFVWLSIWHPGLGVVSDGRRPTLHFAKGTLVAALYERRGR